MAAADLSLIEWKNLGNQNFQNKQFQQAINCYETALLHRNDDPSINVAPVYLNMALCYSGIANWNSAISNCKIALQHDQKYEKAYFRLIKCLLEAQKYIECRLYLLNAIRTCGETKDFKLLESEYRRVTGLILRPTPNCFDVVEELGDGNFSKVFKVTDKSPERNIFAMKIIEKATVEKTRRRHPNVDNEVMMEKRILTRLTHPNIINLYSTFQDQYVLYYQMEFAEGGDLWSQLHDTFLGHKAQVGLPLSRTIFVFAELLNAVEYMHGRGVVHRDLKPENIMLTSSGHIKVIDFGTAKDIIQPDLNGPDFVGTSEYMCPTTVSGKPSGIEADLWALGVILFQLVTGYTPFSSPTPYLTFLRIKRSHYWVPAMAPEGLDAVLNVLLNKDGRQRFKLATANTYPPPQYEQYLGVNKNREKGSTKDKETTDVESTVKPTAYTPPNYDSIRLLPFFSILSSNQATNPVASIQLPEVTPQSVVMSQYQPMDWQTAISLTTTSPLYDRLNAPQQSFPSPRNTTTPSLLSNHDNTSDSKHLKHWSELSTHPAVVVPRLSELCIKGIAEACVMIAVATAAEGGVRPNVPWMKDFSLMKLSSLNRHRVMHWLARHERMHQPTLNRLFWSDAIEARSRRAICNTNEYLGYNYSTQGNFQQPYIFTIIADPSFTTAEYDKFKLVISAINKLRPKYLVVIGNLTAVFAQDGNDNYAAAVGKVRRSLARVLDTIPVLYVPGVNDVGGPALSRRSLELYRSYYGADYYGFWFSATRCIIVNSCLLQAQSVDAELQSELDRHEAWLEEEIEQAKLSAMHVVLLSFHSWLTPSQCDEYGISRERCLDENTRVKWIKRLRNKKVKFVVSTCGEGSKVVFKPVPSFAVVESDGDSANDDDDREHGDDYDESASKKSEQELGTAGMTEDEKEAREEEKLTANIDEKYAGPYQLVMPSITATGRSSVGSRLSLDHDCYHEDQGVNEDHFGKIVSEYGIRVIHVTEEEVVQHLYSVDDIPPRSVFHV